MILRGIGLLAVFLPIIFLLFSVGEYLTAFAAAGGAVGAFLILRWKNKAEKTAGFTPFEAEHPGSVEESTGLISCPKCGHSEQQCHRASTQTLGIDPFYKNIFEVKCAQCNHLLFREIVSGFFSTFDLAKLAKPHRHTPGDFSIPEKSA